MLNIKKEVNYSKQPRHKGGASKKFPIKYTKKGVTMSQLNFQIDGEFLTNIARNWFWKENKDYEKSEELLCSCMPKDADVSLKKNIV